MAKPGSARDTQRDVLFFCRRNRALCICEAVGWLLTVWLLAVGRYGCCVPLLIVLFIHWGLASNLPFWTLLQVCPASWGCVFVVREGKDVATVWWSHGASCSCHHGPHVVPNSLSRQLVMQPRPLTSLCLPFRSRCQVC